MKAEVAAISGPGIALRNKRSFAEELRGRIVRGQMGPGSRLPTQRELKTQFGVNNLTVQAAFDTLEAEGFIVPLGRSGTFVHRHPPHLFRYGLVFPNQPPPRREAWSPFFASLERAARTITGIGPSEFRCYYGVDHYFHLDQLHYTEDAVRLLEDMDRHQLAGVIHATEVGRLEHTAIFKFPEVPMVAVSQGHPVFDVPVLKLDYHSFFERAVEHLSGRGKRRVAAVVPPGGMEFHQADFERLAGRVGLETRRNWWLPFATERRNRELPAYYAPRMLGLEADDATPDGLIIADDGLVESTLSGLGKAGMHAGEELEVVCLSNFQEEHPWAHRVHSLGFCPTQLLATAAASIRKRRAGKPVPPCQLTGAIHSQEQLPPASWQSCMEEFMRG